MVFIKTKLEVLDGNKVCCFETKIGINIHYKKDEVHTYLVPTLATLQCCFVFKNMDSKFILIFKFVPLSYTEKTLFKYLNLNQ